MLHVLKQIKSFFWGTITILFIMFGGCNQPFDSHREIALKRIEVLIVDYKKNIEILLKSTTKETSDLNNKIIGDKLHQRSDGIYQQLLKSKGNYKLILDSLNYFTINSIDLPLPPETNRYLSERFDNYTFEKTNDHLFDSLQMQLEYFRFKMQLCQLLYHHSLGCASVLKGGAFTFMQGTEAIAFIGAIDTSTTKLKSDKNSIIISKITRNATEVQIKYDIEIRNDFFYRIKFYPKQNGQYQWQGIISCEQPSGGMMKFFIHGNFEN